MGKTATREKEEEEEARKGSGARARCCGGTGRLKRAIRILSGTILPTGCRQAEG